MSNINPNNVDGTYPVAGQDNDSQGFRDNFTNIKNNLSFAKSELEDFARKAVLKAPLIGTMLNNDFNDAPMSGAKIKDFSETVVDHGTVTGLVVLDHTAGHYHTMTLSSDTAISFENWPLAGAMGRMRVAVDVPSNQFSLLIPETVVTGADSIVGFGGDRFQFINPGLVIFEFTTSNGGLAVAVNDLTRARVNEEITSQESTINTDVSITSSTLSDIGLSFDTVSSTRYAFSALIPFQTYNNGQEAIVFSVAFSGGGSGYSSIEIQEENMFKAWTITAPSDVAARSDQYSNTIRMCKISGIFTSGKAGTVTIQAASMRNMWIAKAGASLTCTRIGSVFG